MTEAKPIRLVIVDDHAVVRSGLSALLLAYDDLKLVGEATNGEEAVHLCATVQPDVVLMDLLMPGMDAVTATQAICQRCPKTQVIVLTSFGDQERVAMAIITRPSEAMQWLNAHALHSPITRHALFVLESLDAIDLAFDTFVCALLDGEIDTTGYPEYNAVVGGVASHWDEATGDMVVRAVVGWGGRGARGDTDRIGAKLISGLLTNVLASRYSLGLTSVERPMPAVGRGGLVCAHCGFASAHERAFYCPKCGMRLLRG